MAYDYHRQTTKKEEEEEHCWEYVFSIAVGAIAIMINGFAHHFKDFLTWLGIVLAVVAFCLFYCSYKAGLCGVEGVDGRTKGAMWMRWLSHLLSVGVTLIDVYALIQLLS
eukprot:CAMPEP_0202708950 /NCGR_PEP_ID=MMETSP1385-20130828/21103_1 /ASSEMBLY_ACC=CAM_ASM_000861 /TAXON_ID=933848 /ORGANISM="Elphidium margaritaceum" /LENGTH=109 /DNA_ID=CAMNT_0049368079 /DNA_START=114 /DNA_END=446 /DNA_ORIENTATION=-